MSKSHKIMNNYLNVGLWLETYYQFSVLVENSGLNANSADNPKTAFDLTNMFEKKYCKETWVNIDWYETINMFFDKHIMELN